MVSTVESRLTASWIIRSPRHYGKFFSARQNGHTFPYNKTLLMWSLVNTANGHILKSQTVEFLTLSHR